MSPYQSKILAHLINMAKLDKSYSWWSAKKYAQIDPHQLADMPEQLTRSMRELQGLKPCEESSEIKVSQPMPRLSLVASKP
jgi:hypothetical protein